MRTFTQAFAAGETHRIQVQASYFRLMEISAGALATVRILRMGAERTKAELVDAGYSFKSPEFFDAVEIICPNACTVKIAVSNGEGSYDRVSGEVGVLGNVSVIPKAGATLANAAAVAVGTAAVVAAAAAVGRRAVYFRAADTNTAAIWLGSSGVTTANAVIRLNPGDVYVDETTAAAAWYAISGSAAQSINVMTGA